MEIFERLFGSGTAASHPGRVRANSWRVVTTYPLWPALLALGWVVSLLAVLDGFHWSALLLLAVATYANASYWIWTRRWFVTGDVCPAVIVSEEPLLVASLTDLTAGDGAYPAIKIRREPAKIFPGDLGKLGKKTITIARYDGTPTEHTKCWTNFHPRPVLAATDNVGELQRLANEIRPEQWAYLQQALRRLPRPFAPGLYRLTDDT